MMFLYLDCRRKMKNNLKIMLVVTLMGLSGMQIAFASLRDDRDAIETEIYLKLNTINKLNEKLAMEIQSKQTDEKELINLEDSLQRGDLTAQQRNEKKSKIEFLGRSIKESKKEIKELEKLIKAKEKEIESLSKQLTTL